MQGLPCCAHTVARSVTVAVHAGGQFTNRNANRYASIFRTRYVEQPSRSLMRRWLQPAARQRRARSRSLSVSQASSSTGSSSSAKVQAIRQVVDICSSGQCRAMVGCDRWRAWPVASGRLLTVAGFMRLVCTYSQDPLQRLGCDYDIREINQELYLAVLAARKALTNCAASNLPNSSNDSSRQQTT